MSLDVLLSKLDGVQGRGPSYRAICPAHESKHRTRTLAVKDGGDGRVLLHCFAGCDVGAIVGAVGMELSDLFPPRVDDDKRKPAETRSPWSPRDAVSALGVELGVAWQLLTDVANDRKLSKNDKERARTCALRCAALMAEIS